MIGYRKNLVNTNRELMYFQKKWKQKLNSHLKRKKKKDFGVRTLLTKERIIVCVAVVLKKNVSSKVKVH